ncbi:MAG: hypothetical protein ABIW82_13960 [Dokdonella sp.]
MSTLLYRAIADSLDRLAICEQDRGQFFYSLVSTHMKGYVLLAVVLLGSGCATTAPVKFGTIKNVAPEASIISLLGQPSVYEGKRVEISGFLAPDWEGPTLFLTSEQCRRYSAIDGIALKLIPDIWPNLAMVQNRWCHYATVVGVFEAVPYKEPQEDVIRLGALWSGFLNDVSYLYVE